MKLVKVAELVLDYELYPRPSIDASHVAEMVEAINAGVEMPPVVFDISTKKVSDGFHRCRAAVRVQGGEAEIMGIGKKYKSDRDIFVDAMKFNAGHGRRLTSCDRARCLIIGERLRLETDEIAGALHVTKNRLEGLITTKIASTDGGAKIPIKRTIRHMAGKKLNKKQAEANERLSGMNQVFYVEQVITLIESGLLNRSDEKLIERLGHLKELI